MKGEGYSPWVASLLILPALVGLVLVFFVPLGEMFARSVADPANYVKAVTSAPNIRSFVYTLWLVAVIALLTVVVAYHWAWLMSRASGWRLGALLFLVLVPFWSNLLVRVFSWTILLRDQGPVNNFLAMVLGGLRFELMGNSLGTIIGATQICLPFAVFPIYTSMKRIDRNLLLASNSMAASGFFFFRKVYLPLTVPGVVAATVFTVVLSVGFFITPSLLGDPFQLMVSQVILVQTTEMLDYGQASAMSVLLLLVTFVFLGVAGLFFPVFRELGLEEDKRVR